MDVRCDGFDRLDAQTKEYGRVIIEAVFGAIDRDRTNSVRMPAEEFRRRLWPAGNHPEDWKRIINSTLGSLQRLTVAYTTPTGRKGQDRLLNSWFYFGQDAEHDISWLRDALNHVLVLEGPDSEDAYVVTFTSLAANSKVRAALRNAAQASGTKPNTPTPVGPPQSLSKEEEDLPSWGRADIKEFWRKLCTIMRIR